MPRDDEPNSPAGRPPAFPARVTAAGVVWVGTGALNLLAGLAYLAGGVLRGGAGGDPAVACSGCLNVAAGVGLLFAGATAVTGKAKDTLGGSVGSLALGLCSLVMAVFVGGLGGLAAGPRGNPDVAAVAAVLYGLGALLYLAAGLLGLDGRRAYLAWRETEAARRHEDDESDIDNTGPRDG